MHNCPNSNWQHPRLCLGFIGATTSTPIKLSTRVAGGVRPLRRSTGDAVCDVFRCRWQMVPRCNGLRSLGEWTTVSYTKLLIPIDENTIIEFQIDC